MFFITWLWNKINVKLFFLLLFLLILQKLPISQLWLPTFELLFFIIPWRSFHRRYFALEAWTLKHFLLLLIPGLFVFRGTCHFHLIELACFETWSFTWHIKLFLVRSCLCHDKRITCLNFILCNIRIGRNSIALGYILFDIYKFILFNRLFGLSILALSLATISVRLSATRLSPFFGGILAISRRPRWPGWPWRSRWPLFHHIFDIIINKSFLGHLGYNFKFCWLFQETAFGLVGFLFFFSDYAKVHMNSGWVWISSVEV